MTSAEMAEGCEITSQEREHYDQVNKARAEGVRHGQRDAFRQTANVLEGTAAILGNAAQMLRDSVEAR